MSVYIFILVLCGIASHNSDNSHICHDTIFFSGLPCSLNQAGLPFDILLLVLVFCLFPADYFIILLIKGGNLSETKSCQSLPFIAMISYNIIAGDTLTKVFHRLPGVGPGHALAVRHFVISVSTILFTLPLSLFLNTSKLGNFMIYGSLEEPSLGLVSLTSVGSSLIVSALFAATGYATFTGYTQGKTLSWNDDLAIFVYFCLGISIITTCPLECFVTRAVWFAAFTLLSLAYDCLGIVLVLNVSQMSFELWFGHDFKYGHLGTTDLHWITLNVTINLTQNCFVRVTIFWFVDETDTIFS
uniref:Solute carrier family 38 member 11 n=1 Tax=Oncorhynchus kisutch TaxID=8019 RepID=A0A8C7IFL6_ONCKI